MEHKIIKQISLAGIKATGKTTHIVGGEEIQQPISLQIATYGNAPGFYLFYLNGNNEIITDTWHETVEDAIEQAEWEFEIDRAKWIDII